MCVCAACERVCGHSSGQSYVVLYMLHAIHIPRPVFITTDTRGPSHYDKHTHTHTLTQTHVLLRYMFSIFTCYMWILSNIITAHSNTHPWVMYSSSKDCVTHIKYTQMEMDKQLTSLSMQKILLNVL